MIMWWDPQPWSEPAVPSLVPFVLNVRLKSEAVKVVTWFWTPSSIVAELKALRAWLSWDSRVACAVSWSECRSKPPRLAKNTWRVSPS